MVIVLQSVSSFLKALQVEVRALIGPNRVDQMLFTSQPQDVLECVLAEKRKPDRTIVVSSAVFHGDGDDIVTTPLNGNGMAIAVKFIDPAAWFFIYSTMPMRNRDVDGVIPKQYDDSCRHVVEFLALDFGEIKSLEELHRKLPWLQ